jgi:hypothetical protein
VKSSGRALCLSLVAVAMLGGGFVRVWRIGDRGFWRDEAWVADRVLHSTCGELATQTEAPLPPLFAMAVKGLGQAVRPPELGLRLFPLFCGLAVPILAYFAARAARAPRMLAVAGAVLCTFSLGLVIWSRELKQYEVEALIATLAAWLVFGLAYWRGWRRAAGMAGLIAVCAVGPWLGYSTTFALTSVLIALALCRGARRPASVLLALGAFGVLALSMGVVLSTAADAQGRHPALLEFWRHWYIDLGSLKSVARACYWWALASTQMLVPAEWFGGLSKLVFLFTAVPIWVLAGIGLWRWPRRSRLPMACWTFGPWVLMAAAAIAHRYPFVMQRMIIYTAPPLIIATAAGVVCVLRACSGVFVGRRGPGMIAGALAAFLPALYVWNVPCYGCYWWCDDYPALLATLDRERLPGEALWVTQEAATPVRYYAGDRLRPGFAFPTVAGSLADLNFDQRPAMRTILSGPGPFWIITTTNVEPHQTEVLRWLAAQGFKLRLLGEFGNRPWDTPQLYRASRR